MFVTARWPGTPEGEGKPQRIIVSSRPEMPFRIMGAI